MRTLLDEIINEFETGTSEVVRTNEQIKSLQQNLNDLLSLQLVIDGDLGSTSSRSESRKAIRIFQDLCGLPQTGLVDANTMNRLKRAIQNNPADDMFRFYIFKNFELEKFTIRLEHLEELTSLKKYAHQRIRNGSVNTMCFMGHTDKSGSEKYNDTLSIERDLEIIRHLHTAWRCDERINLSLIPPTPTFRVKYYGLGEKHPIPAGTNSENRRVEVILLKL